MDFSHVFNLRRWRTRFRSEQATAEEAIEEGRTPDASVEDVGAATAPVGFDGKPRGGNDLGNGYGTGNPHSSGWAGFGA